MPSHGPPRPEPRRPAPMQGATRLLLRVTARIVCKARQLCRRAFCNKEDANAGLVSRFSAEVAVRLPGFRRDFSSPAARVGLADPAGTLPSLLAPLYQLIKLGACFYSVVSVAKSA